MYNYTHSHINSASHMRIIGLCEQESHRKDSLGSLDDIMESGKEKVNEAMLEVSTFASESNVVFQLVTETIGHYSTLSKVYISCMLDNKWIPLFPKTGSLRQCMIEHMKSKLHITKTSGIDSSNQVKRAGGHHPR